MARLQRRSLRQPDEFRPVGRGTLELVELGDTAYGRTIYQPGWRWSEDVRPIVGTDLCEVHHIGFCLQGRLRVVMADGIEVEIQADDVFEIPPGHDAWVVGDEPWIGVDSRGRRNFGVAPSDDPDRRVLGTIMFTDIVGSTTLAATLGDAAWHDLMAEFMNKKNGGEWASLPVAVFYTRDFKELLRYFEYPDIYHKDRIRGHQQATRPGESEEQAKERSAREFTALQASPFFDLWASAAIDQILSALHERMVVGP